MKRRLSFLLIAVILLSIFNMNNVSAKQFTEDELDIIWLDYGYGDGFPYFQFCEGLLAVSKMDYDGTLKSGYINADGNVVIDFQYDEAYPFSEGLAVVRIGDNYGYIDRTGKMVIEPKYYSVGCFKDGIAVVRVGDKYGYINKEGKYLTEINYDEYQDFFSDGLAVVRRNNKYGYIDTLGQQVIEPQYDMGSNFSEGLVVVRNGDKYGYINKAGEPIVAFEYEDAGIFSEGLAAVKRDGKYGYINEIAEVVIPFVYDQAHSFSEGLATVKKDGKCGYINKAGEEVISPKYDEALNFIGGLALVKKDDKYGYINKSEEYIAPIVYDYVYPFSEGLSGAIIDEKLGYLNRIGEEFIVPQFEPNLGFDEFSKNQFKEGLAVEKKGEKYGYIDRKGEEVIAAQYDKAYSFNDGVAIVEKIDGASVKIGILKKPLLQDEWEVEQRVSLNQVSAKSTPHNLSLNGEKVENFEVYLIGGHNYYKLRDVAQLVKGTDAEFSIDWNEEDRAIYIGRNATYEPIDEELIGGDGTDKFGFKSDIAVQVDGEEVLLDAYIINDHIYYQIRPLAGVLGFDVGWNDKTTTVEIKVDKENIKK